MKKLLSLTLALAMVFALCSFGAVAYADNPVVKIGVFEPQSGDNGAGGKQEVLGMQYGQGPHGRPDPDLQRRVPGPRLLRLRRVHRRQRYL